MSRTLVDVTDLVEFLQRNESVSGVQRVVAEVSPLLREELDATCVFLDRSRGVFVEMTAEEQQQLVNEGARVGSCCDGDLLASAAAGALARGEETNPVALGSGTTLVFLGALWINDALMLAARNAQSAGATIVSLLYDLTPVLEKGHTASVNKLFERYLTLLMDIASRVPAISQSSRRDFELFAHDRGRVAPDGRATGLPCGLAPSGSTVLDSPWPRPYALFVGTIESRKNHLLAFRAWEKLVTRNGADRVPDLVCVGRLGWHATEFLRSYVFTKGLGGKVSVLSANLGDGELAGFYEHAEFTVYPSRYEGWGLPVSESLAFGKVPVVADNSSLREAGLDLAVYFSSDDIDSFVDAVEANVLNRQRRQELQERIRTRTDRPITWQGVADVLADEIRAAERREPMYPSIELGREYMVAVGETPPDEGFADQYLDYLVREGLTPMLQQPRGERDFEVTDAVLTGTFGAPQTWGNEIRPGHYAQFRFSRPVDGPLVILVATRPMPGRATVEASGPGGPIMDDVYLGSVVTLPVGNGRAGEPAQVRMTVTSAHDSVEGFLGIRSFVVVSEGDARSRTVALESAAEALRQELDFLQGTRSWKVTAPLRKWKGRGA